jgi:two-component system nitrate/nitrite response regulator NarL
METIDNDWPARPVRVVIADDECLFRTSLRQLLAVPPTVIHDVYGCEVGAGYEVVGEAATGEETIRAVEAAHPDLLLLDLCMPRMSGLDVLRELASRATNLRTILLTGSITNDRVLSAVRLGVRGLIVKHATTELLFEAIASVMAGRHWLDRTLVSDLVEFTRPLYASQSADGRGDFRITAREREVLGLVVAGYANKEIAQTCSVSEETVKHHLTRLFDKVGASNRGELAALAARHGLDRAI